MYDALASLSEKGFVEETSGRYNAVNPLSALDSRITQFKSAFEKEQLSREEAPPSTVILQIASCLAFRERTSLAINRHSNFAHG